MPLCFWLTCRVPRLYLYLMQKQRRLLATVSSTQTNNSLLCTSVYQPLHLFAMTGRLNTRRPSFHDRRASLINYIKTSQFPNSTIILSLTSLRRLPTRPTQQDVGTHQYRPTFIHRAHIDSHIQLHALRQFVHRQLFTRHSRLILHGDAHSQLLTGRTTSTATLPT